MWYICEACDGFPRAFTMIGYTLEAHPRYRELDKMFHHSYWYRCGAELGDPIAAYNLGLCYRYGEKVAHSDKITFFWFRKTASWGHAKAMVNAATALYNGSGVKVNKTKSLTLYREAARRGDRIAQRMLNKLDWS